MIASEHEEEILQFINDKIRKVKRERPIITKILFTQRPNISHLAEEIPKCVMDYSLRDIIIFLIKAQREGKIFL